MEWVETTGKTVEAAKDAALDQLGIAEDDAEFEVLEEPRTGLFGRTRGEARVRARVRPTSPRPKVERRGPRRKTGAGATATGERAPAKPRAAATAAKVGGSADPDGDAVEARPRRSRGRSQAERDRATGASTGASTSASTDDKGTDVHDGEDASVEDQAAIIRTFLDGLVDAFELTAEISENRIDDDTIELQVNGEGLGLLVGPKGQTLQAIHELSRTIVQRKATGTHHGRVRIDVAGYRQRRQEALARFATEVASEVARTGVAKALEAMHPADRKVVHDTVNEIAGVRTSSEGEEPRRRVVVSPADD
ncbi:MAG: RNA-binding cell elongation regulator Jag/EloR [Acidimicrobiales bacterium]